MGKRAVSLTLTESNVLWLQALTARGGARSLSEAVDRLISDARADGTGAAHLKRSVIGTIDIAADDPALAAADAQIRELFDRSIRRPVVAREHAEPLSSRRGGRKRG